MSSDRDIAIIGMAALFPGAADLAGYWRNLERGVDAIRDVPADRIDPRFFAAGDDPATRFYCRRGGFLDPQRFDPVAYGIMPSAAAGAEPDQLLALDVASKALADAGYGASVGASGRPTPGATAVVLGRGGYLTPGMARLSEYVRTTEQVLEVLRTVAPSLGEAELAAVRDALAAKIGAPKADSAIGLVPNLAASRIANRLDLHGPAYTVDAACASSLVAVDHARRELCAGSVDLALAGGVHMCHDVTFWSVFSQLGALSRAQAIRPFDRRADGLLIGEGVGVVVLKRLADAERDGDRIYAVVAGTGVASDGRGTSVMKPRVEGQVAALRRAWADAGRPTDRVGMIEAHGTGTPAGDRAELETLRAVFGDHGTPIALGSVKSMIGHTMPAAGIAGLIKAALALHHGTLPPTLHVDQPHELLEGSRLRPVREAAPWDGPRVAGVNAFGFGGINAHVVVAGHEPPRGSKRRAALPSMALWAAPSTEALVAALDRGDPPGGEGPCRLALEDPTPSRVERAKQIAARGKAWHGRKQLWFSGDALLARGGSLAFVFPGIEASFDPKVDDLAAHFGLELPVWAGATELERHGGRLIGVGRLLDAALRRMGIVPAVIAGHSIGEWSGMIAAEMVPADQVDRFVGTLTPGELDVPDVVFAALGCGVERALEIVGADAGVVVTHDNCPHQSIICGAEPAIEAACARLREARVFSQVLPFRSGFHSPAFASCLDVPRRKVAQTPLQPAAIPLWSATSVAPYPSEPDAIRQLVLEHLVEPVRFRQLVQALYAEGVRAFVQVGTGSLTSFIEDTLRDRPHLAISANEPKRTGLEQLRQVAAAVWVEGGHVAWDTLPGAVEGLPEPTPRGLELALGVPVVALERGTVPSVVPSSPTPASTNLGGILDGLDSLPAAVAGELRATMDAIAGAARAVVGAWQHAPTPMFAPAPAPAPTPIPVPVAPQPASTTAPLGKRQLTWRRRLSLADMPFLADHCFYRQPEGWSDPADRFPVVPMTMHLQRMMDAAAELVPELTPIALEKVRAFRWCAVEPAIEIEVCASFDGVDRCEVRMGDYAVGTVVMAPDFPEPPPPRQRPITGAGPTAVTAAGLYEQRWMFHGPQYQCVTALGPIGTDGIEGTLTAAAAPGSLLDNAGQLFGYWVMSHVDRDFLAFPSRIKALRFYGPQPAPGTELRCRVWIDELTASEARSDMQLHDASGRVWCEIEAWIDHRFDSDEVLWPMLRFPEQHIIAVAEPDGYYRAFERWSSMASRELIARRFLDGVERAAYEGKKPRARRGYLLSRIAAKDAVRDTLWRRGGGSMFPIEVPIRNDDAGRPYLGADLGADLRISLAHKDDIAVAMVGEGVDVGIDVERIEPRGDAFADMAFSPAERGLRGDAAARGGGRDEWCTRLWAAKEAVAKALGTGLEGNPRRFEVRDVAGDRLLVATPQGQRIWAHTRRDGDYVVAWTRLDPPGPA